MIVWSDYSIPEYNNYLGKKGILVGPHTAVFEPRNTFIDLTRPFMLEIGDFVKITRGCVILVHDYSCSVVRKKNKIILGETRKTIIGNNVFLGMNSIVLPGTEIGNNVIIGAGAVVKGKIPDNVVYAGNPGRIISTLDEYLEKKKKRNLNDAKLLCLEYKNKYGHFPEIKKMEHYFPEFLSSREELDAASINLNWNGDDADEILQSFLNQQHSYNNYEDFLRDLEKNMI